VQPAAYAFHRNVEADRRRLAAFVGFNPLGHLGGPGASNVPLAKPENGRLCSSLSARTARSSGGSFRASSTIHLSVVIAVHFLAVCCIACAFWHGLHDMSNTWIAGPNHQVQAAPIAFVDTSLLFDLYPCQNRVDMATYVNWPDMPHDMKIGDTVAYTDAYLDRQSRFHPDMRSAQGKITALHSLKDGGILADIEWNRRGLPKRVNIKNLSNTGR